MVLTGDNHNHWVMELKHPRNAEKTPPVATEFLGSSISSTGDGSEQRDRHARLLADNPDARYLNSRRASRGTVLIAGHRRHAIIATPSRR